MLTVFNTRLHIVTVITENNIIIIKLLLLLLLIMLLSLVTGLFSLVLLLNQR